MSNGKVGGSTEPRHVQPIRQTIEDDIRLQLNLNFRAGDAKGLEERRQRLRNAFNSLAPSDAKALYDRLKSRHGDNELSKLFHYKLGGATRKEMLNILQSRFSGSPQAKMDVQSEASTGSTQAARKMAEKEIEGRAQEARLRAQVPTEHPKPEAQASDHAEKVLDFDGLEITTYHLPTTKDREEGRRIFSEIGADAYQRAEVFSSLGEDTVSKILSGTLKGAELVKLGLVGAEMGGVVGLLVKGLGPETVAGEAVAFTAEVAAPVVLGAAALAGSLYEIGEADEAMLIANRRRSYYSAYAEGMAAGLDPKYQPDVPKNPFFRAVYEAGRAKTSSLSPEQQRQLAGALIWRHEYQPPTSADEYGKKWNGQEFKEGIMDFFESSMEYMNR